MPENKKAQKLNPEVAVIELGVRHLRKVTFYPLSAADQLKMTGILEDIFKELVSLDQGSNKDESLVVFFKRALEIINENIALLVKMVSDEDPDELLNDLTNSQLVKVVEYIYKTNFEGPLKNLLSLFQKEGDDQQWRELILNQSLPQSVKSTGTDSKTATEKVSEKEV